MALFKQMIGRGTRIFLYDGKLSFDIIDYAGATALFEDPDFDGPPESVVEEEIDDEGEPVDETVVASPEPPFETPEDVRDDVDPDDLEEEPRAKYYVDDVEVWVTAEAVYHLDPETERLRLVEYRDFVADTVRSLYPDPNHLRACRRSRPGRQDVLDALAERGIDAGELAERTGLTEADPLDMLVHLAWNQPLATRTDRARRVRKERSDFFEQYSPAARDVLKALLDKYADHGIGQLDDLSVLEVQPLAALGTPTEIASRFGSSAKLRAAATRLGELLYAS